MYEKESIHIGEKIHKYRKLKKMTLEQLGRKICKSKATVQKYEKNEILPDIYVLVDICNVLGININQLVTRRIIPLDTKSRSNNIFNTDKMYMYYLTDDKLITSILDVYKEDEEYKVRCYNGFNKFKESYAYCYDGTIESDGTVAYILLDNSGYSNLKLEKVQIIINMPWIVNPTTYYCFVTGLTVNGVPVIKRGIITKQPINNADMEEVKDSLKITKEDAKRIMYNNSWLLTQKDYPEVFYKFA